MGILWASGEFPRATSKGSFNIMDSSIDTVFGQRLSENGFIASAVCTVSICCVFAVCLFIDGNSRCFALVGLFLGFLKVFCGGPRSPKNWLEVVATSRPDSSRVWPLPTGCRTSSGARIIVETRAVHVRCARGAFILPNKTHNLITCWVIPCAKCQAVCVFWDVFRAAASPKKTLKKVEARF